VEAAPPVAAAPASYEFTAEQNETMNGLANAMSWVAVVTLLAGAFWVVLGVRQLVTGHNDSGIFLIQGALSLVIGYWTRNAALQFGQVAGTTGADMQHLMSALRELREIYRLQKRLIFIGLALMAVFAILVVLGLLAARPLG